MEIYLVLVVILFALAVSDLVVGVSNDAVNFLNSAIGSKVGSRKLILLIASLGILCGALFSSGMMEVARKGIFHPELFTFSQVMVIFMAVMLTDIVLLDLFNTFGMPTSTTVSIVFELLGAAVVVSLIHLYNQGQSFNEVVNYINTSKAILIVVGIFLSIIVAFGLGAIAQFVSRMLFTFNYKKKIKRLGPVWGGVALSIMCYFLIIKGMKGTSLFPAEFIDWVMVNTVWILIGCFGFWMLLLQYLVRISKFNILKTIVFAGTFSLAMAFANNDLVNFIGVPIAGFESFQSWRASSAAPSDFLMTSLDGSVQTPTLLLVLAGFVMVVTLWKSKRARSVTATEVNLSRQGQGHERFKSNWLARVIVIAFRWAAQKSFLVIPAKYMEQIERRYQHSHKVSKDPNPPAFDLVRAAVNLTIASMIIALATSYKLPLSTTYVSFMVAMGTSLADRAWGSETAVYRVAGVINVIFGWFMTALIAFTVAGLLAFILSYFGMKGLLVLLVLLAITIFRSMKIHRNFSLQGRFGGKESGAFS